MRAETMPIPVSRRDGNLLTFAGLWERWGEDKLLTCTILTADASDGIRDLHTRMPVILPPDGFEPRLGGADPVTDPSIDQAVQIVPVSPKITSPRYNEPDCVEALAFVGLRHIDKTITKAKLLSGGFSQRASGGVRFRGPVPALRRLVLPES